MLHPEHVFVYGTLRPSQPGRPPEDSCFYPEVATYVEAVEPAYLCGAELYDLDSYPAARPGEGIVRGDLLTIEATALAILDHIEGHPHLFRRAQTMVQTESGLVKAWIYWAPQRLIASGRRIASGDWFERRE